MATHIGNEGTVAIGANTIAEVASWSFTETLEMAEAPALGDTYIKRIAGLKDSSGSITCFWDETDSNGQEAMTVGATVVLNLYPEGATTGDVYFTGNALITERGTEVSGPNDTVGRTFSFVNVDDSGITQGTVA